MWGSVGSLLKTPSAGPHAAAFSARLVGSAGQGSVAVHGVGFARAGPGVVSGLAVSTHGDGLNRGRH